MPEPSSSWLTTGALVGGIGTACAALFKWMLGRQVARIDDHDGRIQQLEKASLTKDDLDRTEARITSVINSASSHLSEQMGDVRKTAERAHERIDSFHRHG